MGRKVEVSVEGFGNIGLKKIFNSEELEGRNIGEVVGMVLKSPWTGSDLIAYKGLMRKIDSTGGRYVPQVATRPFLTEQNRGPVKFMPARIEESVDKYLGNKNELDFSITPAHITAYK